MRVAKRKRRRWNPIAGNARKRELALERWARLLVQAGVGRTADECWPWPGRKNAVTGYGVCGARFRRPVYAHRHAWESHAGRHLTEGEVVCHRCDNPICVNPQHLFVGTQADNIHDAIAKGRFTQHTRAKRLAKRRERA